MVEGEKNKGTSVGKHGISSLVVSTNPYEILPWKGINTYPTKREKEHHLQNMPFLEGIC